MNDYRQRLQERGYIEAFESARDRRDQSRMASILRDAGFAPIEIESILWSKGDIGSAPTPEQKRAKIIDEIMGRIGVGVVSGVLLGGAFVYSSSGLQDVDERGSSRMDALMSDYDDPADSYYRPFLWGFAIGGVGGLVTGNLVMNPLRRSRAQPGPTDNPDGAQRLREDH